MRGGAVPLILNLVSDDVYGPALLDPGTQPSGL